ncbi:LuxR C-terminal-related transcriptional regulator [uncultured Flavobacterium sp.]|uniref:LuxR C-terminal-related transcriptional regulator n=1 Tax=uncultured Flavobacterium sp. TaxID=165435 RepID=UPI0025F7DD5D|nr:LuxR C-terminal-related transcriptional regulator [uncultured Flavobacterium sp.]
MELIRFDQMKKTWLQIARHEDGDIAPSFELEVYKRLLDIFHPGEFYYYVVNLAHVKMEMVSANVATVHGIHPDDFTVEYIYENLHPEDKARFIAHEQKVTEFFNSIAPEKVMKYKVSYDYRLRSADGSYKWILMQTTTIQTNEEGAVIRVLGVQTDITALKTDNKPSGLSFIGLDGEPSFLNVKVANLILLPTEEIFSKREKEILRYLLSGKSTLEIVDILHISRHTVNSHRKSILQKSGCNSLVELGAKAVREAWV